MLAFVFVSFGSSARPVFLLFDSARLVFVFLNSLILIISRSFDLRRYDWAIRRGCGDGTGAVGLGRSWLS